MLDAVSDFFGFLWGGPMFVVVFGVGLYFTFKLKFFQLFNPGYIWQNTVRTLFGRNKQDTTGEGQLKSLQVAAAVLSGTLGAGSIAGVATAIATGGPGAIFWMWVVAFVGMITKFVEVTLAVYYREQNKQGEFYGGPMYYIRKGLGSKWTPLATTYTIALLVFVTTDAGFVQTNTMASTLNGMFGIPTWITGIGIALIGALVIFRGIKALGAFCTFVLPPIVLLYYIGAGWVILTNLQGIPQMFAGIVHYAFAPGPIAGGIIGSTIMTAISRGAARGLFTNEAGMGTSATVHATANVDHPIRQGMWGIVEVFVVSFITCNVTAFMVLLVGMQSLTADAGILNAFHALGTAWPPVLVQVMSFGISLILFTSYLGSFIRFRTALYDLLGDTGERILKWAYFIPPLIAVNMEIPVIWLMADVAVGFLIIPNLIALFGLRHVFMRLYEDFRARDKAGTLHEPINILQP
ncbi:alanine/glycine:cation symporter family protein [Pseudomonas juntendi]|uniref:Sodium:alanine symporter family protein n=1 Tax=Pseudomonas juntendi TaxID=2666183 RepID=A0A7W2LY47_9PSED|nr:sodium:alanine symporter family protein [Pseudomonas juntendi]MBA6133880.1 sodium:alanine symporter family protein [Pseudomonas juntendi]MBA6149192.1 sodium:alanine symporter family protein [Pseudomonas juntendi]